MTHLHKDKLLSGAYLTSVTVIIVNWNGGTFLDECLTRLTQHRYNQLASLSWIMVVLMILLIGQRSAGVTVRMLGANLGFAAANNRALRECDTELVALLNPDAFPT